MIGEVDVDRRNPVTPDPRRLYPTSSLAGISPSPSRTFPPITNLAISLFQSLHAPTKPMNNLPLGRVERACVCIGRGRKETLRAQLSRCLNPIPCKGCGVPQRRRLTVSTANSSPLKQHLGLAEHHTRRVQIAITYCILHRNHYASQCQACNFPRFDLLKPGHLDIHSGCLCLPRIMKPRPFTPKTWKDWGNLNSEIIFTK